MLYIEKFHVTCPDPNWPNYRDGAWNTGSSIFIVPTLEAAPLQSSYRWHCKVQIIDMAVYSSTIDELCQVWSPQFPQLAVDLFDLFYWSSSLVLY